MAEVRRDIADLKIALVHDALTVPAGAEKVLAELHKLFPHAPIYAPLYRPEKFPEYKDATVVTSSLNRFRFARNHHQMMIPLLPYYQEQFDLSEFDIVISDSSSTAKGVLTRPDTLHICYCHTPMRWAWMPYLDKRASSSWLRRLTAHYLRLWDVSSVNRVDAWLANSATIAGRIRKFYNRDAQVIYPPVEVGKAEANPEHENFYLTVGRLVEQKRVDIIIEGAKKAGVKLKIAGDGPQAAYLKKIAGKDKSIEFLGRVSNEVRDDLYKNCRAFIFASEEDAGIVPVEAMAYGKPVIAFGRGGGSETVLDGKTGVHFHDQTADSLAAAIVEFQNKSFDSEAIAKHAARFSSARFRDEMLSAVLDAYEAHKKRYK